MASTIQLKRGSGAPTSGDLATGELGLDLTNNRIYSSTNGTDIVELGTNPTDVNVGTDGNLFTYNATGYQFVVATTDMGLRFSSYISKSIFPCAGNGDALDNVVDLGILGARFDDIYATNGTIQTSDANEKQDIEALSVAEQLVAARCKNLVRKYRWKSSVAEKGSEARTHFGVIAQDVKAAFEAEGLNASDYGLFIESTWTDDNGVEHTRLGVRYTELFAFIISAL